MQKQLVVVQSLKSAAQLVYNYAGNKMKESLEVEGQNNGKTKFADYIIFGLSRNVVTELVKFVGKGVIKTRVADREFRNLLASSKYDIAVNTSGDPKIIISLNGNRVMQIRYKLEVSSNPQKTQYKFYPRHYLEALEGMFTI